MWPTSDAEVSGMD